MGVVALLALGLEGAEASCPNMCNQRGRCDHFHRCICNDGWGGFDCSVGICPKARAWADEATAVDTAHNQMECSNMGQCTSLLTPDGPTQCLCRVGFEGASCQRMTCPAMCSAHGKCMSMHELATVRHNYDYSWDGTEEIDGTVHSYKTDAQGNGGLGYAASLYAWDYDMVHGCVCDAGYAGYDCTLRTCPRGDDPETKNQKDEKQLLQCVPAKDALGAALPLSGTFTINFRGKTTAPIPFSATAAVVQAAILSLSTVRGLSVEILKAGVASQAQPICSADALYVAAISFTKDSGPQPRIKVDNGKLVGTVQVAIETVAGSVGVIAGAAAKRGTKEHSNCAGRGLCDETTGVCTCYKNYGIDLDGTCGNIVGVTNICPGELPCSGHGVCEGKTCICSAGWETGDCSMRGCPKGPAWFGYPDSHQSAHDFAAPVECSNQGVCDRTKGECTCNFGFTGGSCEVMACGGEPACSGHGRCLTMSQLAAEATVNGDAMALTYGRDPHNAKTWDHAMVSGCKCDPGYEGYDCILKSCPRGDDPETYGQTNEIQFVSCMGTGGAFKLGFRQKMSPAIAWNADASAVEKAIEAMPSAGDVNVTFLNMTLGPGACNHEGSNIMRVEFMETLGNVPAFKLDKSLLENINSTTFVTEPAGTGALFVAHNGLAFNASVPIVGPLSTYMYDHTGVMGTREEKVCSGRGACDFTTGICTCFKGYAQSDGKGGRGIRGDCGYRNPYYVSSEE